MKRFILSVLFTLLALPAFSAAPDIGDNSLFVCIERKDESGCFGEIASYNNHLERSRKGKRVTHTKAINLTNRYINFFNKKLNQAIRNENPEDEAFYQALLDNANETLADLDLCDEYLDAECSETSTRLAEACTKVNDPANSGTTSFRKYLGRSNIETNIKHIINGSSCTSSDESPVVGIGDVFGNYCTGTLIAGDVVLTAAHCLSNEFQCVGEIITTQGGTSRTVSSCEIHPRSDLALLFLNSSFGGAANVASLNTDPSQINIGSYALLAGYGQNEVGDINLRATFNRISNVSKNWVNALYSRGDYHIGSTCYGDSGGPVFVYIDDEWRITGVLSYGTSNTCGLPGGNPKDLNFWTNVGNEKNLEFIREHTSGIID